MRARYKPSNHCAGNAGMLRLYLYARVRILECILHTRPRVLAGTRHSLRPLIFEGKLQASLGRKAPRDREGLSSRMGGAKRYPSMPVPRGDGYRIAPPILRTSLAMTVSCSNCQNGLLRNLDPFNP